MKPLVSVILTVYKRIDFFEQALLGALNQSFGDREIIVADDSGCRAAYEICKPYVAAGKIIYKENPRTLGVAASLREALREARGSYIAILNDDDVWEPEFLSRLVAPLEADATRVLAFSDHWIIDQKGEIDLRASEENTRRYARAGLPEGDIRDKAEFVLVKNGVPLAMAALFRRDALDLNLLVDAVSGAYDFWISCVLAASTGKFYYVPQRLTRYRVHSSMETGRRSPDKSENSVYIFSQLIERGWFPTMRSYIKKRLSLSLYQVGRDLLYFDRWQEARAYFRRALLVYPNGKAAVMGIASFFSGRFRWK